MTSAGTPEQGGLPVLSRRLNWSIGQTRLSRAIERARSEPISVLDLTCSNPTAVGLPYPHDDIAAAFCRVTDYSYRPDPLGMLAARREIAAQYERNGLCVSPEQIVLTSSTSEGYSFLFKLLCDAGDEVLVPSPSYPLFDYLIPLDTAQPRPYKLAFDGAWFIDFDDLEQQINSRTKAIAVVNPNNPTGQYLKRPEAERLAEIAVRNNLAVICDEVFVDFPLHDGVGGIVSPLIEANVATFFLNGLSKGSGMPQVKLAWIVAAGAEAQRSEILSALELISDTYLSVGTAVQLALPELLQIGNRIRSSIRQRTVANLAAVNHLLGGSSAQALRVEGGWSVILQLPQTRTEEEWCLALLDRFRVIIQPGYLFDMPREAYIVVSLLTQPDDLVDGIGVAMQLLNE
jgi:alanine-synthesizing transaminase